MNKELFDSMQKQMTPSPQVRAALSEKLAQAPKKRPVPWMKYAALAACAALVVGAFPLYQAIKDQDSINGAEILWTHRAGGPPCGSRRGCRPRGRRPHRRRACLRRFPLRRGEASRGAAPGEAARLC